MTLDLRDLETKLKGKLTELEKERAQIEEELRAVELVKRATGRGDLSEEENQEPVSQEAEASQTFELSARQSEQREPTPAEPEETAQPEEAAEPEEEAEPEEVAQVEERRQVLEETVMAFKLDHAVAVMEVLKMFQKPLSVGKIADELVAIRWNFQDQHPRAVVEAELKRMENEGKVKQANGTYRISA